MGLFKKTIKKFTPEYKKIEQSPLIVEVKKIEYKEILLETLEKLQKIQEEILDKIKIPSEIVEKIE